MTMIRPATDRSAIANFRRLWFGEGVSLLGNATSSVLIPLLAVTQLGAGPLAMGLLSAAAWVPWLILGLPAGALLDDWPPRRVMIVANLVGAAAVATVPIAVVAGRLTILQLLIVALTGGAATVFFHGAYAKLLAVIVRAERLEDANAKMFGTESAMSVAGPGLAGALAQSAGAVFGLVFDVVSYLVGVICLRGISMPPRRPAVAKTRTRLVAKIRDGVGFLLHDRYLRVLLVIGGTSNFGLTGYGALLVLYLVRELHLDSAGVGVVIMVGSAGGLIGALIAQPLSRRFGSGRASTVLMAAGGPAAFLVGAGHSPAAAGWCVVGLVAVGAAVVAGNVIRSAWRQRYVPQAIMGRVITSSQVINYGTMPVAGVVAGVLGTAIGVRETMLIMAGVHAIASLSILFTAFGRCRDLPVRR